MIPTLLTLHCIVHFAIEWTPDPAHWMFFLVTWMFFSASNLVTPIASYSANYQCGVLITLYLTVQCRSTVTSCYIVTHGPSPAPVALCCISEEPVVACGHYKMLPCYMCNVCHRDMTHRADWAVSHGSAQLFLLGVGGKLPPDAAWLRLQLLAVTS